MNDTTEYTQLMARIKAVWQREQMLNATEGALAFLRWVIPACLCGLVIDWLIQLPASGRAVLLFAVIGLPLVMAWRAGWKKFRAFNPIHTALRIETLEGRRDSLLVTALQLQDATQRHGASESLCKLTCQKAEESASSILAREIVRFRALRRPATVALTAVVIVTALFVLDHNSIVDRLTRLFVPWVEVAYPTRTKLMLEQENFIAQEGRPVHIEAVVSRVIPEHAEISIRTGKGKPRVRKIAINEGTCKYVVETAYRSFQYRIKAGDARTDWHSVEVIKSPAIQRARVQITYPDYTERPVETVESLTLTVPETTKIAWTLTLDQPVKTASVNFTGTKPVPLTISNDGLTLSGEHEAMASRAYTFSLVEKEHEFEFRSPNQYLQVAPDRPPSVELTSPRRNMVATLGRKLDLAFRGRDDHGVKKAFIIYGDGGDKVQGEMVEFKPVKPIDGTEQTIDWDYRTVMPDIEVGQVIKFAIELHDAYPGQDGPNKTRSVYRRLTFMTMEGYLAEIERQKKRLLTQLRTIYKEERDVHEIILRLDPNDPVFVQTCQLEAVRQDLLKGRLGRLSRRALELEQDLKANGVNDGAFINSFVELRNDLDRVSVEHVAKTADALRDLSGLYDDADKVATGKSHAVFMVNNSARELGLMVLQLGFVDAADVMAYELHAAAQTQSDLRLRTSMPGVARDALASEQERLGKWLARLFAASPRDKESTKEVALIEFTLTRIVKQMLKGGIDKRLADAAKLIRENAPVEATKIQSEVIAALVNGEFRLRVGAEREALTTALRTFESQNELQRALRTELEGLSAEASKKRMAEFARRQTALHNNLQLLLVPEIPAPRAKLFDEILPPPPKVSRLMAQADAELANASSALKKGDLHVALGSQAKAENLFAQLADIMRQRIADMTRAIRIQRIVYGGKDLDERIGRMYERQLALLEKLEEAGDDGQKATYLIDEEKDLAESIKDLRDTLILTIEKAPGSHENSRALPDRLQDTITIMLKSVELIRANKPFDAAALQEGATYALEDARAILGEHMKNVAAYASTQAALRSALVPSRFVGEIEEEQRDMMQITEKAKEADLPMLALPQKNLIHAVDAILAALDPVAHMVESGTVTAFVKEDMDAAGIALEEKDSVEALDAQDFVVETMEKLRKQVESVVPQYIYVSELTEALHENVEESILIRDAQRRLMEKAEAGIDAAALAKEQTALISRTTAYAKLINEITGFELISDVIPHMTKAETALKNGDASVANESMLIARQTLKADTDTLLTLLSRLGRVLSPLPEGVTPPEEFNFLRKALKTVARQKDLYRDYAGTDGDRRKAFIKELHALETACTPLITEAEKHAYPVPEDDSGKGGKASTEPARTPSEPVPPADLQRNLVIAKSHLAQAIKADQKGDPKAAVSSQRAAAEGFRHFITKYALTFYYEPPGSAPGDPAPTSDFNETEDDLSLYIPGSVTGTRPPDGKLDWVVLGKRDRAALNENFARELPLEFRAILKDYYERLSNERR